jgi:transcriptional regulator with XRE-family HTH domain
MPKDLRTQIKSQMKRKKLSVPALARALGLNQQTLYNYLAGKSELTAANLEALLAELDGTISFRR